MRASPTSADGCSFVAFNIHFSPKMYVMKKRLPVFVFFLAFSGAVFGQVWAPKAVGLLPANYNVADICIVNEQVIWAVTIDYSIGGPVPASFVSKLLRSTDGGETWDLKDIEEAKGRLCWDIHAFDANTACIISQDLGGGPGRGIFRTTDGGEKWTEVFHHVSGGVLLHFFDAQEGLCWNYSGGKWFARTTDGGQNWTLVPPANIPDILPGEGQVFSSASNAFGHFGNTLWFGTGKGRTFKTEDRGKTWAAYNTGLGSNSQLQSMGFLDEKNGLAVSWLQNQAKYDVVRTTDGGLSWAQTGHQAYIEVDAIPCTSTFIGASGTGANLSALSTALSTDHGATWVQADTIIDLLAWVFLNPELGWAAVATPLGTGPALYKWIGGSLDTRIYVNQNATGANTGASWADAYTDLQAALAAAQAGDEIWVAEGTYKPAAPGGSQTATFLVDQNLKLYGGFAGSECYLSERDVVLHPTVLSGDLNGDDVVDDFVTNRGDNVLHVVQVTAAVTPDGLLDGFSIRGGQADGSLLADREGGGLYCFGAPVVRNCIFEQNNALGSGGGLALIGVGANSARVEYCRFENNRASSTFDAGGGLYIRQVTEEGITVDHCAFTGNTAASRGSGIAVYLSNLTVTNTLFSGNINDEQGGGLWFWPGNSPRTLVVDSCTFENNSSSFGGGVYASITSGCKVTVSKSVFDGNTVTPNTKGWGQLSAGLNIIAPETSSNALVTINEVHFSNNHSSNSAGGLGITLLGDSTNVAISNCVFEANRCTYYGSALSSDFEGTGNTCVLKNCRFFQNIADSAYAAADLWAGLNGSGVHTIDSCLFEGNVATGAGGLSLSAYGGGKADFFLTNSLFKNNNATALGGGLGIYSTGHPLDDLSAFVENCVFEGNSSSGRAGAILLLPHNDKFEVLISRSTIVDNQSPSMGAIGCYQYEPNTSFKGATIRIENSLIAGNQSEDATISVDSTGHFSLLHCTVADNTGGGIQLSDQSGLRLQNTILHNPGFAEYTAGTNDVAVASLGGNLIGDGSLGAVATPWDLQNTDPLFAAAGDYHLDANSPAIDKGVDLNNLPDFDLDGNARVNRCPDIGAYESAVIVSTACVVVGADELSGVEFLAVSPNPAVAFLNIQLPEASTGPFDVEVFDAQGRLVLRRVLPAGQLCDVQTLEAGFYVLKVAAGERVFAGKFVKQ
jgi:photosystem II stability/assembly factor-like uncharacterized protein